MKLKYVAIVGSLCLIACTHKPATPKLSGKTVSPDGMLGHNQNGDQFEWDWLNGQKPGHGLEMPPDPPPFDPNAPAKSNI